MSFYRTIIAPVLDRLDSERMHGVVRDAFHLCERSSVALKILEWSSCCGPRYQHPLLHTSVGGVKLENPLIVAAGWDKNAESVAALWHLGFAGVEIGSVLEHSQPGNPKPRQFMIGPGVALNRLGFNSKGMEVAAANLERYRASTAAESIRLMPIGINIGKNRDVTDDDAPRAFAAVAGKLYHFGSYFVVNVSSPNTPGLRRLQDRAALTAIVSAVLEVFDRCGGRRPLFVKIAPELTLSAVDEVLDVVLAHKLSGLIATNTTINPEIKAKYGARWREEPGGVSGDDPNYRQLGLELIRHIYRVTQGSVQVIGVGGVKDTATALEKICAGASAVQIMTGLRGEGLGVVSQINRGVVQWMEQQGVKSLGEIVGSSVTG